MSDKTKLDPDLEAIECALRCLPVPKANIDRDQLMYDSGFAAALTQPKLPRTTGRGLTSLVFSFASGAAIAATVLFSLFGNSVESNQRSISAVGIVSTQTTSSNLDRLGNFPTSFDSSRGLASVHNSIDVVKWIQNIPPSKNISSGFTAIHTSPKLAQLESNDITEFNRQSPKKSHTSTQLFRELLPVAPNQTAKHRRSPSWPAWLRSGT